MQAIRCFALLGRFSKVTSMCPRILLTRCSCLVALLPHPCYCARLNLCRWLQGSEKQGKVSKLTKSEMLMLNIGSMCTGARIIAVRCYMVPWLPSRAGRPSQCL